MAKIEKNETTAMKVTLTESLVRAAAQDKANARMRKQGRTTWNKEDYRTAVREFHRLLPLKKD